MKLIFDIEGNGLLDTLSEVWMIVAKEVGTDRRYVFSDHAPIDDFKGLKYGLTGSIKDGLAFLGRADMLSGHNVYGYDLPALKQMFGWEPDYNKVKIVDTLILSWLVDYKRQGGHSLGNYGTLFKFPKGDFKAFHEYSKEMLTYCVQDVDLNEKVYMYLFAECSKIAEKKELFKLGMKVEHKWAYYEMRMREKGWKFDEHHAHMATTKWRLRMEEIEGIIEPQLKTRVFDKGLIPEDRIFKKNGEYYKTALQHLEPNKELLPAFIQQANKSVLVGGAYTKVEFVPAEMGNMDNVKQHLLDLGWKPDDYNVKREAGKWVQTGPKLTTSSLNKLDEDLSNRNHDNAGIGELIDEYYTLRSRRSVTEGWIKNVKDGRLHPRTWVIGTPTFRCRHEVVTNIPGVDSPGGKDMRSLFVAEDGYKVVGADSSGNQFRALAHYMRDEEFTHSVIAGSSADGTDVHTRNANIIGVNRKTAKPFIYALLFGAGDEKLGLITSGVKNREKGREARLKLMKGLPGLKALKEKLDGVFFGTQSRYGRGCFPALDGRLVYPESGHQALNYLLQAFEAITCKAALVYAFEKMDEEGLDYYPTLFMHDEIAFVIREDQAERGLEIAVEAMREGPKMFGVDIMDGDGSVGDSYADVH
jgi:DNA polymerase-1